MTASTAKKAAAAKAAEDAPVEEAAPEAPSTPVDEAVDSTAAPSPDPVPLNTDDTAKAPEVCGAKLSEFNHLYRDDIACVLPAGHPSSHTDGVNGQWPGTDAEGQPVYDPMHLCPTCFSKGWPAGGEYGERATCAHGSWVYPIVG